MSWITQNTRCIFSQERAADFLRTSSAVKPSPSAPSKSRSIRKVSSPCDSPTSQSGMTSQPSAQTTPKPRRSSPTSEASPIRLSLPAAFRARILAALDAARALAAKEAASGVNTRVSFARFDRDSCSWKIPQCLLTGDWATFLETWPRWGMMRHGECYPLKPLAPDTNESGFGFQPFALPTPTVCGNDNRKGISPKAGDGLATVAKRLDREDYRFPTAQAHDAKSGTIAQHGWGKLQRNLNDLVKREDSLAWPSPCATDYKGPGKNGDLRDRLDYAVERGATKSHDFPAPRVNSLCGGSGAWQQIQANPDLTPYEKREMTSTGGALNPDWEEWLMFWPIGWTDLDTPNHRLVWYHPTFDPAAVTCEASASLPFIPRLTTRRKYRVARVKAIGNGQYPPTAFIMAEWGFEFLQLLTKGEK